VYLSLFAREVLTSQKLLIQKRYPNFQKLSQTLSKLQIISVFVLNQVQNLLKKR